MLNKVIDDKERPQIIESLLRQKLVGNNLALANEMADQIEWLQVDVGDILIEQGGIDKDVYLLFSGQADVVINGRVVSQCQAGDHVGELATLGATPYRSAHIIVTQGGHVAKLNGEKLERLANIYPEIYRCIAQKLARLFASMTQ